jgi:mevalonate kinase
MLGEAMDLSHGVLSGLALVSPGVDEVVRSSREAGALGAKMSGAGGVGGAFVALAPDQKIAARIRDRLKRAGALVWIERI